MTSDPRVHCFRAIPADLGEGVVWHAARQKLAWLDITGRRVLETALERAAVHTVETPELVGAVVPAVDGRYLAVLHDGIYHLDPDRGTLVRFAGPPDLDRQRVRFNDAKCDARGRLWAGTMALQGERDLGKLYRIDPDGRIEMVLAPVSLSNGLAWSPEGKTFYYIDTPTRLVLAFDFEVETGTLHRRRVALDLHDSAGFPDGCTTDAEGRLWVAHWGGGCVTCWDPSSGQLLDTLRLPATQVTTCTFGGPNLDQLFITTAASGLSPAERLDQPEAGFLFCAEVKATGLPAGVFGARVN